MGLRAEPTYRQRRFGAEVRGIRERIGLSVAEAAKVMATHASHLSNIEAGRTSLSAERLRRLAALDSSMNETHLDALIEMGGASGRGWWTEYRDRLRPAFLDFAELEASARTLLTYEPTFIPGLLQTPEYALASYRGGPAEVTEEEARLGVEFRLRRQHLLDDADAPALHAIIHEAALHASFGDGPELMRGQLLRLIEVSRLPRVTLQILPFAGPVPFDTSFTMVEPSTSALSTVYVPHVEESLYLGVANAVARYGRLFDNMRKLALPPVDTGVRPEVPAVRDSLGLIRRLLYPLL